MLVSLVKSFELQHYAQRQGYEQYGSKLAFAFLHAHSETFWFYFFSFKSQIKRFGGPRLKHCTLGYAPKPVLIIAIVERIRLRAEACNFVQTSVT
jgi:hypothetical protein